MPGTDDTDNMIMFSGAAIALLILLLLIIAFMAARQRFDRQLLKARLEIREQTLRQISGEIHDNMGQVLSLVVLNLSSVEISDQATAAATIEKATILVQKVVSDLRRLSKILDAEAVD